MSALDDLYVEQLKRKEATPKRQRIRKNALANISAVATTSMSWSVGTVASLFAGLGQSMFSDGIFLSAIADTSSFNADMSPFAIADTFPFATTGASPSAIIDAGASPFDTHTSPSTTADASPFGTDPSQFAIAGASWFDNTDTSYSIRASTSWFAGADTFLSAGAADTSLSTGIASAFMSVSGVSASLFPSTHSYISQSAFVVSILLSSLGNLSNSPILTITTKTESKFKEWLKTANLSRSNLSTIPSLKWKRLYDDMFIISRSFVSDYT